MNAEKRLKKKKRKFIFVMHKTADDMKHNYKNVLDTRMISILAKALARI